MTERLELLRKYSMNAMTELGAMMSLTTEFDQEENNILTEVLNTLEGPERLELDEQLYEIHCYLNELNHLIAEMTK